VYFYTWLNGLRRQNSCIYEENCDSFNQLVTIFFPKGYVSFSHLSLQRNESLSPSTACCARNPRTCKGLRSYMRLRALVSDDERTLASFSTFSPATLSHAALSNMHRQKYVLLAPIMRIAGMLFQGFQINLQLRENTTASSITTSTIRR